VSAPAVAAVPAPQRIRILIGKKIGRGPLVIEHPQPHAAASRVRQAR